MLQNAYLVFTRKNRLRYSRERDLQDLATIDKTLCEFLLRYYNKPDQRGLLAHFQEIGKVGLPVVLYNIPGRTGITMDASTIAALHEEFPSKLDLTPS